MFDKPLKSLYYEGIKMENTYPVTNREIDEFIYNMFERENPPSVFRLALIQLNNEGYKFNTRKSLQRNWNRLIDTAIIIRDKINLSKRKKSDNPDTIGNLFLSLL